MSRRSLMNRIQETGDHYCKVIVSLLVMIKLHDENPSWIAGVGTTTELSDKINCCLQFSSEADEFIPFKDLVNTQGTYAQLKCLDDVLEAIFRIDLNDQHSPSDFVPFHVEYDHPVR
jgi:hypothetical protein